MKEHNSNSACNYTEQLISFLYGESDADEKSKFEFHLQKCPVCSEELTSLSAVRTSIFEWRNEEFEQLATPVIELPNRKAEKLNSSSWLNSLKTIFTLNSVGLSATAATILLVFGLFWFFSNRRVENEVAENRNTEITNNFQSKNSNESQKLSDTEITARVNNESEAVSSVADTTEKNISYKKDIPVKNVRKDVENKTRIYTIKKSSSSLKSEKNTEQTARKPVKNNEIPTLAVDEYEDNSLRLSDILDEVSMK